MFLDGSGTFAVAISANNTFTIDTKAILDNSTSAGNWTVSATAAYLNANASINLFYGAGIAFTVSASGGISQAHPQAWIYH